MSSVAEKEQRFGLHDRVTWSSQSQANRTTKTGVIVDVLPEGVRPSKELWPSLHRGVGCGYGRTGNSYIVKVGTKIYWPHAKNLRLAEGKTK